MVQTTLIAGYTNFINEDFLAVAFPDSRIVITSGSQVKTSTKDKITVIEEPLTDIVCEKLFKMYDFDNICYFSSSTAPFQDIDCSELQPLAYILRNCSETTRALYVMGPEHPENDPVAVLESTVREMCRHSSWLTGGVNVVVSPWIYALKGEQQSLFRLFEQGDHEIPYSDKQDCSFVAAEDIAVLINRLFDNWQQNIEPYYIANVFKEKADKLTSLIERELDGEEVSYTFAEKDAFPISDSKNSELRFQFIWFPTYSFFDDIPEIIKYYKETHGKGVSFISRFLKRHNVILQIIELLIGYGIMELLLRLNSVSVQFNMIDFRLLYVVVIGTMYNMYMGLGAALLASLSLAFAYFRTGTNWFTLFYEPTNWLPFIAFFTVGALCGYIRSRDLDRISFANDETQSIRERYDYLSLLNEDILQEKHDYKQQIIGSRDSFGKIFDITRQLDSSQPKYILGKAVDIIERVMSNRSVGIYDCRDGSKYGRLSISSRGVEYPFSNDMTPFYGELDTIEDGEVWVNRELKEEMPMYMYAIKRNGAVDTIIMLKYAEAEQMTLYYQNLFKILSGLISASLMRASDYQKAVHDTKCVPGSSVVLYEDYFREELSISLSSLEKNLSTHLCVSVELGSDPLDIVEKKVSSCIRNTDEIGYCDGTLYVILYQAQNKDMQFIGKRFEISGLEYELMDIDAQLQLISPYIEKKERTDADIAGDKA